MRAAFGLVARIGGAGVVVVAGRREPTLADTTQALVSARAGIAVVARHGVVGEHATLGLVTRVIGAEVLVVTHDLAMRAARRVAPIESTRVAIIACD